MPGKAFDTPSALAKSLAKATKEMRELDGASAELGATLVSLSRRVAPHRTGALGGSIAFSVGKPGKGLDTQVRVTAGNPRVPYANPIHFGWKRRNIAPTYFLMDPLGRMVDNGVNDQTYLDKVTEILTDAIGA